MHTSIRLLLAVALELALGGGLWMARAQGPGEVADLSGAGGATPSPGALFLGEPLLQLDLQTPTGDDHLVGIEFDGTHYWVTGGNSFVDPNKLYKLSTSGALEATYDQPAACSDWGGRDMAFDGSYLYYGCEDGLIHKIDPATGGQVGTIATPLSLPRALAYDPATDHFWTANWDSTLYEINRLGAVVDSCPAVGLTTYGLAWDASSLGGPYLWLWSQDGSPLVRATQFRPATCELTGVGFQGINLPGGMVDTAAGATLSAEIVPGRLVLLALHQAEVDTLVGYDLEREVFEIHMPVLMRGATR